MGERMGKASPFIQCDVVLLSKGGRASHPLQRGRGRRTRCWVKQPSHRNVRTVRLTSVMRSRCQTRGDSVGGGRRASAGGAGVRGRLRRRNVLPGPRKQHQAVLSPPPHPETPKETEAPAQGPSEGSQLHPPDQRHAAGEGGWPAGTVLTTQDLTPPRPGWPRSTR